MIADASVDDLVRVTQDRSALRAERLAVGAQLARVGDPRPGVLTLEPAWCVVDAGVFVMGSASADSQACVHERPQALVRLPAFRIARYPVTNGQWQRFADAGGYEDPRWWSGRGWHREARPAGDINRPVVGVSWYEALAFSKWLSVRLGYNVRMCTEAEWEKAARGVDGRLYPFGDELDAEAVHASALQRPSAAAPVGCYPRGLSPWGVEDMVGNTYAWTSSRWAMLRACPPLGTRTTPTTGVRTLNRTITASCEAARGAFPCTIYAVRTAARIGPLTRSTILV